MPFSLTDYLVIGISTRALFNLAKENEIYEREGIKAYSEYQLEHENEILDPGPGFSLVKSFLQLNEIFPGKKIVEVIIMSRNNADTSLRVLNSIQHYGLDITRAAFSSGRPIAPYLKSYAVDLFLSANEEDVQVAIDSCFAAALIYDNQTYKTAPLDEIRIAFDGDAVLFSEESEMIYQEFGIEAFQEHEKNNAQNPLTEGPFAKFLKTLSFLQHQFESGKSPIRTALVTSRNSPAHERVIRTLRAWNVRIDEVFFLGGAPKDEILKAFGAHIFFDDQDTHLKSASKHVTVAKVPFPSKTKRFIKLSKKDGSIS